MQGAVHRVVKLMDLGAASQALNVVTPPCPWPGDVTAPRCSCVLLTEWGSQQHLPGRVIWGLSGDRKIQKRPRRFSAPSLVTVSQGPTQESSWAGQAVPEPRCFS